MFSGDGLDGAAPCDDAALSSMASIVVVDAATVAPTPARPARPAAATAANAAATAPPPPSSTAPVVARPIPPPSANEAAALAEVFDDLCLRFLYNLPESEFESFPRLFFAVEQAYWFYLDFSREAQRSLPPMSLRTFARRLFEHSPPLRPHLPRLDELVADWKSYKGDIPTCGAALLNRDLDKVLLVRAYGSGGRWGFPKGKIGKDETPFAAAMREVAEEVGYDATPLANERDAQIGRAHV